MFSGEAHSHPSRRRPRAARVELVPDTPPPPAGGVVKLDAAECEIVSLVACGLTNRAIAARLGRAESTVKSQLSRVYRKLGISRRVRLMMMFRP